MLAVALCAAAVGCAKRSAAPATAAGGAPDSAGVTAAVATDAAAPTPVMDAGVRENEVASTPLACGDDLFVVGRTWIEERTSSATATGPGGYMRQTWPGTKKTEQRPDKKILAMEGDAITRMRVRFVVDRDPDRASGGGPNDQTGIEGKTAVLVMQERTVSSPDATADVEAGVSGREAEIAPEVYGARWRGDARARAAKFRNIEGWNEHTADAEPPWGAAVLSATPLPRTTPLTNARAFSVSADAHDEEAGLGHRAVSTIHVSGTILVGPDGALLESRLRTRSTTTERLNHGCGRHEAAPCPWSASATVITDATFRVVCERR